MRRHEQEIKDPIELKALMDGARVCRVAFNGSDYPYIVPVCFGRVGESIYFHSAKEGEKIDRIKADNRVCFEMESDVEIVPGSSPCKWSMRFKSVIGFGKANPVTEPSEKIMGLNAIMEHYSGVNNNEYKESVVDITEIIRIDIDHVTGKISKQ